MSKAGVAQRDSAAAAKTVAEVKRRKRVEIVKITVDGAEVDAKECTKCGVVKILNEYHKRTKYDYGHSACRSCTLGRANPRVKKLWTDELFKETVKSLVGEEYAVKGYYQAYKNKIEMLHVECGTVWGITPKDFIFGYRCPSCAGTMRKTHLEFIYEIRDLVGDEYSVMEIYESNRKPLLLRHNPCGHEWKIRPNGFLRGARCPLCLESKGERRVSDLLFSWELNFERQFKLCGCRNKKPLPFDFAVTDGCGKVLTLIEYDGLQHERPVKAWGGDENLARIKMRDRIKTEYCRANDIPLIRIDYKDFDNIETILTEELTKLGVIGKRPNAESEREVSA